MSNRIKFKYIGEGAYVVGVPARDIREEEAAEWEDTIKANMETPDPCYREVKHAESKPAEDKK